MNANLVSVSWGDHLEWGTGDGSLARASAIERSIARWHQELNAGGLLWRESRSMKRYFRHFQVPNVSPRSYGSEAEPDLDEHRVVIDAAHENGMQAYLYVTMFDEGWPLELGWGGGFEARQSHYVIRYPMHQLVDRAGNAVHHGVLCFNYPEVRRYRLGVIRWLLEGYDWDGVFICTRSQSRPAQYADQFGFNEPVVKQYQERYGIDITRQDFDLDRWRRVLGEGVTQFLREVAQVVHERRKSLIVGIPRADYVGPPVGNLYLDWRTWLADDIIDGLVIDQWAAICPSAWMWLWPPTEQGYGYVENYQDPCATPLEDDVRQRWGPATREAAKPLYLARQWQAFESAVQNELAAIPDVTGLVFSSFRYDNAEEADWNIWPV
ncbi:MAG: family 10 glycosylhydrolase [Nitrolancea sp.]